MPRQARKKSESRQHRGRFSVLANRTQNRPLCHVQNRPLCHVSENQWANALKNGQKVRVNIDVHYDQGGVRPSSFDVSYTIDDVYYYHEISN